jgi:hypothetical protein
MSNAEKLTADFTKNLQSVVDVATLGAKERYSVLVDAASQIRRHQSTFALAVSDRSKVAVERAVKDGSASIDFARRVVDHETKAAKSFATVKSPIEFLVAQDAYFKASVTLYSSEIAASINRFFEALGEWAAWPTLPRCPPQPDGEDGAADLLWTAPHSGIDPMLNIPSDFIGAVRRCVGDAVVPAAAEIELVAAKIWRVCASALVSPAGWPAACGNQEYYRRAARIALEGCPHQLAL